MSQHHVQRCQVSCHAEGEARRRWSDRCGRHRGPGNHGDHDIRRWNLLRRGGVAGFEGWWWNTENKNFKYLVVFFLFGGFFCGLCIYVYIDKNWRKRFFLFRFWIPPDDLHEESKHSPCHNFKRHWEKTRVNQLTPIRRDISIYKSKRCIWDLKHQRIEVSLTLRISSLWFVFPILEALPLWLVEGVSCTF